MSRGWHERACGELVESVEGGGVTLFRGKYRIESARLKGYDYASPGAYFVTICTQNREHFFGGIEGENMQLSDMGKIAENIWRKIPDHFVNMTLDEFVVMPNHVHGVIHILDSDDHRNEMTGDSISSNRRGGIDSDNDARLSPTPSDAINRVNNATADKSSLRRRDAINRVSTNISTRAGAPSLSRIIRWYKGRTTYEIRKNGNPHFAWQARFHDHIVRDDVSLNRIRAYIRENPRNWVQDDLNPSANCP